MVPRQPPGQPVDGERIRTGIARVLATGQGRAEKAAQSAELIRSAGGYRWVGVYAVTKAEIRVVGWSGQGAPAHPRFPVTQGLSGVAVAERRAVVVNDVTADPRYLTAFATTLSEAIIPIIDPRTGTVEGTLDVESARRNAFSDADRQALEEYASALAGLFTQGRPPRQG